MTDPADRSVPLPEAAIEARLSMLPSWQRDGAAIVRVVETAGWKATLMVVNAIGFVAEAAWHHPDLVVGYGRVEIRLTSHDAGGLTPRDFDLAARIDALLEMAGEAAAPASVAILKRR